ncbi:MAG: ShlB/FhaC/HecB family hemolysin secretion/activation protein [Candidatus Omnitrophica bacterium]|nr:ShlB/FhaC/HecB family hemolysin secretion/activation protein [Candidatus Omnitrophota bacterium]
MRRPLVLQTSLFLLCGLLAGVAWAAQRDIEVGSEEERLRRPRILEVPERAVIPVEIPPEEPLPATAADLPPVLVAQVVIDGATVLPEKEARRLTAPVEGRTVSLKELQETTRTITRWYRGKGYVTSRALVPAQTVQKGSVRLRVVEGKVGLVKIEGNRHFSTELLQRYLRIHSGEVFNLFRVEEGLVQLNAHPDRKAKLVLTPAKEPETSDLILQVTDQGPFHANYGVDTLGTKETGLIRQSLGLAHGNLTGHDDQLFVRGIVTEFAGLWGGAMSYLRPLTPRGAAASLEVSGVKSSVGGDLKNLIAKGNALTISPSLILPWVKRAAFELEATAGFDFKRVRTFRDERSNSKDDLRVFRVGTNLLSQDVRGRSLIVQELRVGLPNILGGSHGEEVAASRAKAGGSFIRWVANLVRIHRGPWGTTLVFRGSGQLTTDRLVPAEQFRLGGFDTVRGYPEGEFLADAGYQATVEVRAPTEKFLPAWGGQSSPWGRLRRSLLVVGFWDFAEGFVRDPAAGEDADMRLAGAGCGLRLRPTSESVLQADFGWAFGDRDAEKDRPRIHLICRIGF